MPTNDERYNTNNPLGSNDPKDLFDNALVFDEYLNSDAETVNDRFGDAKPTLSQIKMGYVLDEAPQDGNGYVRQDGAWTEAESGVEVDEDGNILIGEVDPETYNNGGLGTNNLYMVPYINTNLRSNGTIVIGPDNTVYETTPDSLPQGRVVDSLVTGKQNTIGSDGAVIYGFYNQTPKGGSDLTLIGSDNYAEGESSTLVGINNYLYATDSMIIGHSGGVYPHEYNGGVNQAFNVINVGYSNSSYGNNISIVGLDNFTSFSSDVAKTENVAIYGINCGVYAAESVSVGIDCLAFVEQGVAMGYNARAHSDSVSGNAPTFAIGLDSSSYFGHSASMGIECESTGWVSVSSGVGAKSYSPLTLSYGMASEAVAPVSMSMGTYSESTSPYSVSYGNFTKAFPPGSVAIGNFAEATVVGGYRNSALSYVPGDYKDISTTISDAKTDIINDYGIDEGAVNSTFNPYHLMVPNGVHQSSEMVVIDSGKMTALSDTSTVSMPNNTMLFVDHIDIVVYNNDAFDDDITVKVSETSDESRVLLPDTVLTESGAGKRKRFTPSDMDGIASFYVTTSSSSQTEDPQIKVLLTGYVMQIF